MGAAIELFTAVIYAFVHKASVFGNIEYFHPSLILVSRAWHILFERITERCCI
jgi:hypothetical protein